MQFSLATCRASIPLTVAVLFFTACGSETLSDTEIVNGKDVNRYNTRGPIASSTVALSTPSQMRQGKSFCSGTLIGENTVVTAAHCVKGLPRGAQVVFGTRATSNAIARPIRSYVSHRGYDSRLTESSGRLSRASHDIAVVSFSGRRPAGSQIISIAPANERLYQNMRISLAGFGRTGKKQQGYDVNDTGVLRTVDVAVRGLYPNGQVFMVRGFDRNGLQGACSGDSGGPAYLNRNGRWYVIGALSTGLTGTWDSNRDGRADLGCIGGNFYTDLRHYRGWLQQAQRSLGG